MDNQDPWSIEPEVKKEILWLFMVAVLGIGMAITGFFFMSHTRDSNTIAYSGLFFIALSIICMIYNKTITINIRPRNKSLEILKKNTFQDQQYIISFSEIESVDIVENPRKDGMTTYHLRIQLKNGKNERIGRMALDAASLSILGQQLADAIGVPLNQTSTVAPANLLHAVIGAVSAVLFYAIWYRVTVGSFCPAMWGGTAPLFIMPIVFLITFNLARRFKL